MLEITRTKDCQEGMRAFVEQRPPRYTDPYAAQNRPFPPASPDKKLEKIAGMNDPRIRLVRHGYRGAAGAIEASRIGCSTRPVDARLRNPRAGAGRRPSEPVDLWRSSPEHVNAAGCRFARPSV